MKKLLYALSGLFVLVLLVAAAPETASHRTTPSTLAAPPADMNDYVGKYKMEGLPFDYITIAVKDGKLTIDTGDQNGVLTPLADADKFDAAGQATLKFNRGADTKVIGVTLEAQGMVFEGKKTSSVSLSDYVGKYKMSGLPFDYLTVTEKEGKLTVDTGSQNGVLTSLPEADKFDAAGQATLKFNRDATQKITGVTLEAQGSQFDGKKEP